MPLFTVKNDITKIKADAIVNAANPTLLGGGGVDGAIHRAAGPMLREECRTLGGCKTGEAKITKAYNLCAKYVIHTVGPVWHGGENKECEYLRSCYRNSLALAAEYGCETVAFPLISAGAYGYPPEDALNVAKEEIIRFLRDSEMTVYLVLRDKITPENGRLYSQIEYYMMQNGISDTDSIPQNVLENTFMENSESTALEDDLAECQKSILPSCDRKSSKLKKKALFSTFSSKENCCDEVASSLEEILSNLDAGFSETLLRLIDESGMTDSECYKRANIDRKLFSKIRSDKQYKPSKPTVLAFAISLRLNLDDTRMLLERAGFALSGASKFDMIIEYFIKNGNYDIYEINDALFAFDQNLLGA